MRPFWNLALISVFLFACASVPPLPGAQSEPEGKKTIVIKKKVPPQPDEVKGSHTKPKTVHVVGSSGAQVKGHRVSDSAGSAGGVVVLWPRIIPKSSDPEMEKLARLIQSRAATVAERALPGATIDVRPAPERVCPQSGCVGASIGVVLAHQGVDNCIVAAYVSPPGTSGAKLLPWVGAMTFKADAVPFREPPESSITIQDFHSCKDAYTALSQGTFEAEIEAALQAAAR